MFYKALSKSNAATGLLTVYADKPAGGKITIREISVYSKEDLMFAKWWGFFYNIQRSSEIKGLYNHVSPVNTNESPQIIFKGESEWPEGWKLRLDVWTQTGDTLRYIVGYEIDVPPKKRWW